MSPKPTRTWVSAEVLADIFVLGLLKGIISKLMDYCRRDAKSENEMVTESLREGRLYVPQDFICVNDLCKMKVLKIRILSKISAH